MEEIVFCPLRFVKSKNKIVVASYRQWRRVKSADCKKFTLCITDRHKNFDLNDYVYNHKGEQLFWFNHINPQLLPLTNISIEEISSLFQIQIEHLKGEEYKFSEPITKGFHWSIRGFDCDGVPVFSHYDANYIAANYTDMNQFEPLTVGMVVKWYGWFLLKLENSHLEII